MEKGLVMDQRSIGKLKFDRRLERRRGWVDSKEVASEIESLPDSADKAAPPEESGSEPTLEEEGAV